MIFLQCSSTSEEPPQTPRNSYTKHLKFSFSIRLDVKSSAHVGPRATFWGGCVTRAFHLCQSTEVTSCHSQQLQSPCSLVQAVTAFNWGVDLPGMRKMSFSSPINYILLLPWQLAQSAAAHRLHWWEATVPGLWFFCNSVALRSPTTLVPASEGAVCVVRSH